MVDFLERIPQIYRHHRVSVPARSPLSNMSIHIGLTQSFAHCSSVLAIQPGLLSRKDKCPNCEGDLVTDTMLEEEEYILSRLVDFP